MLKKPPSYVSGIADGAAAASRSNVKAYSAIPLHAQHNPPCVALAANEQHH